MFFLTFYSLCHIMYPSSPHSSPWPFISALCPCNLPQNKAYTHRETEDTERDRERKSKHRKHHIHGISLSTYLHLQMSVTVSLVWLKISGFCDTINPARTPPNYPAAALYHRDPAGFEQLGWAGSLTPSMLAHPRVHH